jgi:hypothetical protein
MTLGKRSSFLVAREPMINPVHNTLRVMEAIEAVTEQPGLGARTKFVMGIFTSNFCFLPTLQ